MDDEDAYQIMPYKEIIALRKDIESLKKSTDNSSFQALLNSMSDLTKSMNSMLELFRTAAEEMKLEGKTELNVAKEMGPISEKMDTLMEQNKTIAEGLIAISDMIKESKRPQQEPSPVFRLTPRRQVMPPPLRPQSFNEFPQFGRPQGQSAPLPPLGPPPGQMPPPWPSGPMPQQRTSGPMPPPGGPMPPDQIPPFNAESMPPPEPLPMPEMPVPPDSSKKKSKFLGMVKK
jgi:hypothetical protein